jgi:DNA-binding transcriptional regulator YhcF (GntR family)
MIIHVDRSSSLPPYEQIRAQVVEMASSDVIADGQRIPTIRQLAGDLGLAEGTVARAYRELEREGWIQTRGRHGSFVTRPSSVPPIDREGAIRDAATAFATRVAQTGSDPQTALKFAREALRSLPG